MRPVHAFEIKVGLLVIAGLVATVVMIMTADKLRIEHTYQITAYLQDAGGLRYESPVTLSGIAVGKVKAIEFVTPGSALPGRVKARLSIAADIILPVDVEAHLATSGVFGDASLALSAPRKPSGGLLPTDGSGTVTAQSGFLDQAADKASGILNAVDDLLDEHTRAEAKRAITGIADLAQHAAGVAARLDGQQEHIATIIANLEAVTGDLKTTTATLNRNLDPLLARADSAIAKAGTLAESGSTTLAHVDAVLLRADKLIDANQERVATMLSAVAGAAQKAQHLAQLLEGGDGILGQLLVNRDLAKDLHAISVDLAAASQQVADKPSRLVFDDSDSARQADQAKRNREKMRRALAEGLGRAQAPAVAPAPAPTPAPAEVPVTPTAPAQ
jgi:phospholipid/cholesterol/gamma-HCH transport system substrate-binding protein